MNDIGCKVDWEKHVDHVFCLTCEKYANRLNRALDELQRVGIKSDATSLTILKNFDNPILKYFFDQQDYDNADKRTFNYFVGAYNHYVAYKIALQYDYSKVLIVEEDVAFMKDLQRIEKMLDKMPKNADLVLLDKWVLGTSLRQYKAFFKKNPNEDYFCFNNMNSEIFSSACYIANRKAMQHFIEIYENNMFKQKYYRKVLAGDHVWNFNEPEQVIKKFAIRENIAIQKQFETRLSDHEFKEWYSFININIDNYQV